MYCIKIIAKLGKEAESGRGEQLEEEEEKGKAEARKERR